MEKPENLGVQPMDMNCGGAGGEEREECWRVRWGGSAGRRGIKGRKNLGQL